MCFPVFFFNDTAHTDIYTLSLHDALPIFASFGTNLSALHIARSVHAFDEEIFRDRFGKRGPARSAIESVEDRKSTRLNSSHGSISYAVFCLKKKKKTI